jgi:hypothetical protein
MVMVNNIWNGVSAGMNTAGAIVDGEVLQHHSEGAPKEFFEMGYCTVGAARFIRHIQLSHTTNPIALPMETWTSSLINSARRSLSLTIRSSAHQLSLARNNCSRSLKSNGDRLNPTLHTT